MINYGRKGGITKRHILLAVIYCFNGYTMKYSGNKITTEEELNTEVEHFYFLSKYNLL